jgi:hypothetical protein
MVGMVFRVGRVALGGGGSGFAGGGEEQGDSHSRRWLLCGAFVFLVRDHAKRERGGQANF